MAKHEWYYTRMVGARIRPLTDELEVTEDDGWEIVSVHLGQSPEILARRLKNQPAAVLTGAPARETHLTHDWSAGTYCDNCGTFFERKPKEVDK